MRKRPMERLSKVNRLTPGHIKRGRGVGMSESRLREAAGNGNLFVNANGALRIKHRAGAKPRKRK